MSAIGDRERERGGWCFILRFAGSSDAAVQRAEAMHVGGRGHRGMAGALPGRVLPGGSHAEVVAAGEAGHGRRHDAQAAATKGVWVWAWTSAGRKVKPQLRVLGGARPAAPSKQCRRGRRRRQVQATRPPHQMEQLSSRASVSKSSAILQPRAHAQARSTKLKTRVPRGRVQSCPRTLYNVIRQSVNLTKRSSSLFSRFQRRQTTQQA